MIMVDIEDCFEKIGDVSAALTFFYLVHKSDGEGYVQASYTKMAEELNRSRSTLHKYVKRLTEIGLVGQCANSVRTKCEQNVNNARTKNTLIYISQISDYKQVVKKGENNARTERKQSVNNVRTDCEQIANPRIKKTLEDRKREFVERLKPYMEKYGKDMLNDFYRYWAQVNDGGTKMLFEKQKCFETGKRLALWKRNETGRGQGRPEDIGMVLTGNGDKFKNEEVW